MRYVAAYLLAVLGGNKNPTKGDVSKILESIGLDIEDEKIDKVMSELEGKDINEVIAEGSSKLAAMPTGGAVAAAGGSGSAEEAPAEKEEEKKEESEEESDDDMGFGGLF